MKIILLLVFVKVFWHPVQGFNDTPSWRVHADLGYSLALSIPPASRKIWVWKTNKKFGFNLKSRLITTGHAQNLRRFLLVSGDIEAHPGPQTQGSFPCEECGTVLKRKSDLNQHLKRVHGEKSHQCELCDYATSKLSDLNRHKTKHAKTHKCRQCELTATNEDDMRQHLKTHKRLEVERNDNKRLKQDSDQEIEKIVSKTLRQLVASVADRTETALDDGLKVITIDGIGADPQAFLASMASNIKDYIERELESKTGIKLQLLLKITFNKAMEPEKKYIRGFRSLQSPIYRGTMYDESGDFAKILQSINSFNREGSGWVVDQVNSLELHMASCRPLRGSTYKPLPQNLVNKHTIINIKNNDNKCFLWSILAKRFPQKRDKNDVSRYQHYEKMLKTDGINFPVPLNQISRFEKLNNLAINVYGFEDYIFPLRISKMESTPWIHLLLYDGHYSLINDLNRLLHTETRHEHRLYFCPRCLSHRSTQESLDEHMPLCKQKEPTKVVMPEEETLKFKNVRHQLRQPMVIFGDFECLTQKMEPDQSSGHNKSMPYQKHIPCGFGFVQSISCCGKPEFKGLTVERCENPVKRFLQELMMVIIDYHKKPIECMKDFDPTRHAESDCHICGEKIAENKVKDHCHICGRYRGPAHNECNQSLCLKRDIVVVFHNLRRYDGHLIMREVGEAAKLFGFRIDVVAKAMEDYLSFSLVHKKENDGKHGVKDFGYKIKFIDSVQFLNNSLDGLVKNLEKDQLRALASQYSGEKFDLLRRKGVYMYDYMDKQEKFRETQLPPQDAFYSKLSGEDISDTDYEHAQNVWKTFEIKDLGGYHDLYLTSDVLLLADVFEAFRAFALEKYGLDPCHYITLPSFAWDACLKMTKVALELLKDQEMYLFCESAIRGGISMISERYAKANNPDVAGYDPAKPKSFIIYLDANNLYGWAMVQRLGVNGFKWMTRAAIDAMDWRKVDPDGDKGYILEVDLNYPQKNHGRHSDYPLAPESMLIEKISPYGRKLRKRLGIKAPPSKKLVPNLFHKKKYILHIRNLQLYLRLGMELGDVHRVLEFNQKPWMKKYISFNTEMRAKASNAFDKDLLKLMNNAVFGKTMENVRNYRNIELVTSKIRFEKLVADPRYRDCCRFTDDLVGVSSLKPSTCLNKPIYCGFTVLDLSKLLMYEFHYDYVLPRFEDEEDKKKVQLLFTDTDSLCYLIETDDIYKTMKEDSRHFDFSDYPVAHPCFSVVNKKVIGLFKDEANGSIISEFVGLRPKMYSIYGPDIGKKRAKGIKKNVVKRVINHQDFIDTLKKEESMEHDMNIIKSNRHELYSVKMTKTSLSPYDDKRWLLDHSTSRAHGHFLNVEDDVAE